MSLTVTGVCVIVSVYFGEVGSARCWCSAGDDAGRSLLGRQGQIGGTRLGAGQCLLDLLNLLLLLLRY